MNTTSLEALVKEHLERAESASSGRSSHTIYGGHEHVLRQTVIAMAQGQGLNDHESPGEATLLVLHGRVRLETSTQSWEGAEGDHLVLPPERHNLMALTRAAVLLTVAVRR